MPKFGYLQSPTSGIYSAGPAGPLSLDIEGIVLVFAENGIIALNVTSGMEEWNTLVHGKQGSDGAFTTAGVRGACGRGIVSGVASVVTDPFGSTTIEYLMQGLDLSGKLKWGLVNSSTDPTWRQ